MLKTKVLRANDRGTMKNDWLHSWHSFSFSEYYNPEYMHFGKLRVLNEDFIAGKRGFAFHPHKDMEIITYMIRGRLHHRDSMGNDFYISAGEIQQMSAGSGIVHSETNDDDEPVHLYQIWILPEKKGIKPDYEMYDYRKDGDTPLKLLISGDGRDGSLRINQDASIWRAVIKKDRFLDLAVAPGRHLWIQTIKGAVNCSTGDSLGISDALAVTGDGQLKLTASEDTELLLFDS